MNDVIFNRTEAYKYAKHIKNPSEKKEEMIEYMEAIDSIYEREEWRGYNLSDVAVSDIRFYSNKTKDLAKDIWMSGE